MLIKIYFIIILLYLFNTILQAAKWKGSELAVAGCALICNGAALLLIYKQSGHVPVYNIFESFLFITFILGCLSLFHLNAGNRIRLWILIEILILLGISLFYPHEAAPSNYNYEFLYVILFYTFRYLSLALMLYASAYYVEFIFKREKNERTRALSQQGRNFLLLSAILFLSSEYVGIIWCQMGWGDFWMWGVTFFQSTFIVLYLMLAFHIPGKGKYSEDIKAVFGGLTGLVVLALTVLRSFF
jgi:hypothetical protein